MIGARSSVLACGGARAERDARFNRVFSRSPAWWREDITEQRFGSAAWWRTVSLVRGDNLAGQFQVSDRQTPVCRFYKGILPTCFARAGRVAEGAARPVRGVPRPTPSGQAMTRPTCLKMSPTR